MNWKGSSKLGSIQLIETEGEMRATNQTERPSILDVVSQYVPLRRTGKEYTGLCPFHSENTPSFTVNEDKGVFHCFGCGEGGDVIRFVEKIKNVDFKEAIAHLGLTEETRPTPTEITKRKLQERARRNLTAWVLDMSERVGSLIREVGQREYMVTKVLYELDSADKEFLRIEIERASDKWAILTTLEEDLLNPETIATLWRERELIEQFVGTNRTYSNEEIESRYPALTEEYKQRLTTYVRGEV